MQQTDSTQIIRKINKIVFSLVLLLIIGVSGFYLFTTTRDLTQSVAVDTSAPEPQRPVGSEEKESLLSQIQQAGRANVEEDKRLDMLKKFSIQKTFTAQEREAALDTLKE